MLYGSEKRSDDVIIYMIVFVEDNLALLRDQGALTVLMEILAMKIDEDTKEQALRALTNLCRNGTCNDYVISD